VFRNSALGFIIIAAFGQFNWLPKAISFMDWDRTNPKKRFFWIWIAGP